MATNPPKGDGHRNGAVRGRSQTFNPKTGRWVKRDSDSGKFMDQKADDKPFKGVRKER
ncbi:MAG: hypothetical protein OET55_00020 [Desulfuromonadales bacterium]|jgi:hypothetical protein|nr:hypothetical protein [Desulfuromonadales bacterium]MDH3959640.1 hypothetical protein [Desulfuromonadales bacterium]MDH4024415.1 hypothetical protein [Desulfuromonadales bacterium]